MTHLARNWVSSFGVLMLIATVASGLTQAQTVAPPPPPKAPPSTPFIVESYYRVRWGSEEEFMALFRKNHVPFLRRQLEKGILLDVRLEAPKSVCRRRAAGIFA